jgi:hypothetical protein
MFFKFPEFWSKPYITRFPYYIETRSFQTFGPSKQNAPHSPYSLKKISSSSSTGAILKNSLPFMYILGMAKFLRYGMSLSWSDKFNDVLVLLVRRSVNTIMRPVIEFKTFRKDFLLFHNKFNAIIYCFISFILNLVFVRNQCLKFKS